MNLVEEIIKINTVELEATCCMGGVCLTKVGHLQAAVESLETIKTFMSKLILLKKTLEAQVFELIESLLSHFLV